MVKFKMIGDYKNARNIGNLKASVNLKMVILLPLTEQQALLLFRQLLLQRKVFGLYRMKENQ